MHEQLQAMDSLENIMPSAGACVKEESDTDTASEEEDNSEFPPVPYRLARVEKKGVTIH